jgi:transposase-like protein
MGRPYSTDLRERVVGAVCKGGLSCHQAAAQFGVGISTAILWVQRFRKTGSVEPDQIGGYKPKKISGQYRDWLVQRCRTADFTLRGLVAELAEACPESRLPHGVGVRPRRETQSQKKTLIAAEQDRPDVARRRAQWMKYRDRIDPSRLVFIDETWTKTNMAPLPVWDIISDTSTSPRHGDRTPIPRATIEEVLQKSWVIMNRFLE